MKKKTNILWIMTDQQRMDSMGCTGGKVISPNMDRLACEGMLFSKMFAQSPVCVPSRINFITGRYPHSHKSRQNHILADSREPPHVPGAAAGRLQPWSGRKKPHVYTAGSGGI